MPELGPPRRRQPQRAVRVRRPTSAEILRSPVLIQSPVAGVRKGKRGGKYGRSPVKRITEDLDKKISAIGAEIALAEQHGLLGGTVESDHTSPRVTPRSPLEPNNNKRKRKRNKKSAEKFMDGFLSEPEEGTDDSYGKRDGDRVRREDRWIPKMEHRGRRPAEKPKNVPYHVWMSYCFLDDYIYRYSMTAEEALTLPLMDDVFSFQSGGSQPVTPAGFRWNDDKELQPA
ncbi:uncharacterized protein F4822DRAFT_435337 [Hypoxylon trugodes]|uniref:uncharacterized protein n=1 Tax=Hypoxylon trugodes TaxID=326681 RepID=UPI00219CFEF1|nr:uncharacterized protein F4822DRAFT_435337 [Hypoxylon trugodes]KAI1382662.1 hypothetical protein F4822DRAFT_435337 [Hypoxylon trugodes]